MGGRVVPDLHGADDIDIILLATLEAELQELVDRLDRASSKYSLLINVDKTKVMASDGIACRILLQNEQLVAENVTHPAGRGFRGGRGAPSPPSRHRH